MKRYILWGLVFLLPATILASVANGAFVARDAEHVAHRLGPEFTGRDVLEYREQMEGDAFGCTGGGSLIFFAIWLGGTYYFGRKKKPNSDSEKKAA